MAGSKPQRNVVPLSLNPTKVSKRETVKSDFLNLGFLAPKYWLAMGTLATYAAVGGGKLAQARAAATAAVDPNNPQSQALPVRRFNIPAGPLETVLKAFEDSSGIHVKIAREGLTALSSPGATGIYTNEQALRKILVDTGLSYRFIQSDEVLIDLQQTSTFIDVTESVAPIITSPKYTEPLRDIPQSITVVPPQVMADQASTTLRDALRNVAGISLAAGEGGAQGDNLTVRGFTARNDIFIDGMRDFGSYYRDPFDLEQIEVLQGPSSVTFGRGSTGGVVNQAMKTAQANPFFGGSVEFGTDATRRGTFDFNHPVPALGNGTAFRLDAMGHESGVAGRDVAESRRFGFAPSLAFGLGSATRTNLTYFHQTANDTPDYGIPWLFNGPAPVARNNYYGFRDANHLDTTADIGTAKVEHDFSANFTLRNQLRYASYDRGVQVTEAKVPTSVVVGTPLSNISVTRNQITVNSQETFLDNQLDASGRFHTGFIRHNLVMGVEGGRETSDPTRFAITGVPGTNLLHPDEDQAYAGVATVSSRVKTTAVSFGAYLLDTMRLGQKWELIAGVRWDRFDADYKQTLAPISAFSRVDEMPTWRTALVYKPVQAGSIYFSYGDSFNPSAESLSLSATTASLPPEKNNNYEAGTKWELLAGRLSVRSALFRTEKVNAREPDPNNPLLNILSGNQRVQGIETEVTGKVTDHWQVFSGYAYLDSKLVSSKGYPAAVGSQLANVPRNTFNLWNNYEFPWHLAVGAGAQFVDSRTASSTAPLDPATGLVKKIPGYWIFNAMARYPLSDRIDLQANLYNIGDKYYYDQIHPGHIVPGAGRYATIGLNFKF